jgi:hypothetical protein
MMTAAFAAAVAPTIAVGSGSGPVAAWNPSHALPRAPVVAAKKPASLASADHAECA